MVAGLMFAFTLVLAGGVAEPAEAVEGGTISISKKEYQRFVRHVPSPDIQHVPSMDIAHSPGGGGFQLDLPDVFEFNVTRDLSADLGNPEEEAAAAQAAANAAEKLQASAASA